jgi:general secretion pathway protein G
MNPSAANPSTDRNRNPARATAPFTLVEILATIAIIVILVGIVIGGAGLAQRKASEARARAEIEKFVIAVEQYRKDRGFVPPNSGEVPRSLINDLESPNGKKYVDPGEFRYTSGNKWRDPFGGKYRYETGSPTHNAESYDVWSFGSDGANGTADDVGNFKAD